MTFAIPADAYARFMGRWSEPLADLLLGQVERDLGQPGGPVLDVGCGPGVLTARLVDRLGVGAVAAIDPSPPFVAATRGRFPGLDVRDGAAENLPWPDDTFTAALAQLVVHFMRDPVAGLGQMRRVTRPGGLVAAAVWDHAGRRSPLTTFWDAVHLTDPGVDDQSDLPGAREGGLPGLLSEVGLADVRSGELTVRVAFASFEDWWLPHEQAAGPLREHVESLTPQGREDLRESCRSLLPAAPFSLTATAWFAAGTA